MLARERSTDKRFFRPATRCLAALFAVLLGMGLGGSAAFAQQRRADSKYRPANPTLSPYVGLLQGNRGAIPNYFSLVRPQLDQRAMNRQLLNSRRATSFDIQATGSTPAREAGGGIPTTGTNAGFGRYLHYYPSISPARSSPAPRRR